MPEMIVKYSKEELEDMLVRLLLRPQGLKLAAVEKPIQWRFRPQLKVVIHAEIDPDAAAASARDDGTETEQPDDPLADAASRKSPPAVEDLDPSAFPDGTNLALLKDTVKAEKEAEKRPLMPGESHERTKK